MRGKGIKKEMKIITGTGQPHQNFNNFFMY